MPNLVVVEAGVSSIQGLGRYGSQRYGIAPGGAMDRMALAEGNALTGLPSGSAAIEIGPLPARFAIVDGPVRIAITGAERDVLVDGIRVPLGVSQVVKDGQAISFRGVRSGQYTYLSIQGGLHGRTSKPTKTSSTHPQAVNSWTFVDGDRVAVRAAIAGQLEQRLKLRRRSGVPIRVILGPQLEYFSTSAISKFLSTDWMLTHAANRMACVLRGDRIDLHRGCDIVSDGTVTGNIQVAGSGQPIVILNDRGTIGGYPKIATIISADLGWFAQMQLMGRVKFESVSVIEAQTVARDFAFELANLRPKLEAVQPDGQISIAALYDNNVAGDAFCPDDWLPDQPAVNDASLGKWS